MLQSCVYYPVAVYNTALLSTDNDACVNTLDRVPIILSQFLLFVEPGAELYRFSILVPYRPIWHDHGITPKESVIPTWAPCFWMSNIASYRAGLTPREPFPIDYRRYPLAVYRHNRKSGTRHTRNLGARVSSVQFVSPHHGSGWSSKSAPLSMESLVSAAGPVISETQI